MDEAFRSFAETLLDLVNQPSVVGGDELGQRISMTALEVDLPVELDVTRDNGEGLLIGSSPPLYPILTTVRPSFHRMRLRAALAAESSDG